MIGERLKILRKKKNMTMKELGKVLMLGESTISLYEKDKRSPDYATLKKIANFFDVSVDFLIGNSNDPTPPNKEKSSLTSEEALQILATNQSLSKKDIEYLKETLRIIGEKNDIRAFRKNLDYETSKEIFPKFS